MSVPRAAARCVIEQKGQPWVLIHVEARGLAAADPQPNEGSAIGPPAHFNTAAVVVANPSGFPSSGRFFCAGYVGVPPIRPPWPPGWYIS